MLGYPCFGTVEVESRTGMNLLDKNTLEVLFTVVAVALFGGAILWLALRKRPSEDELERARRKFLVQSGRLVDGMLLDITEMEGEDGRTLTLLIFHYRISGVDYECSQDITMIRDLVDQAEVRIGYPCTIRYQPGNPQNSIVIAEGWSGLRARIPKLPTFEDPDPVDTSHLSPGKDGTLISASPLAKSRKDPRKTSEA